MVCRPDPHDGSTHTVSLKEPFLSACMTLVPLVSVIGIFASRVSPTRPDGLKFEPRRVSIPHRGTGDGVTCNESTPFPCDGCDRIVDEVRNWVRKRKEPSSNTMIRTAAICISRRENQPVRCEPLGRGSR